MSTKNRLTELLKVKTQSLLSIYLTAGYPSLNDTLPLLSVFDKCGVDFVEIGFPYSDPMADGKIIQRSSEKALKNGMTLEALFTELSNFRRTIKIPVLLMGYLNPVLQFGIERFAARAAEVGIDGTIIPDLPLDYYRLKFKKHFEAHNLSHIFLATPQTEPERVSEFDSESTAFLYAVSGFGVTGQVAADSGRERYLAKLRALTGKPIIAGFGISSREDLSRVFTQANGAVIGSAFIDAISRSENPLAAARDYIASVRGG